jgi:hypothetical protein
MIEDLVKPGEGRRILKYLIEDRRKKWGRSVRHTAAQLTFKEFARLIHGDANMWGFYCMNIIVLIRRAVKVAIGRVLHIRVNTAIVGRLNTPKNCDKSGNSRT